jgi:predicted ribosomally synthesized peptide with nif11-like leader
MSQTSFEQFRLAVLSNPALQEKLRVFEDKEEFISKVVETGIELGFEFTASEVEEAIRASHSEWILRWV